MRWHRGQRLRLVSAGFAGLAVVCVLLPRAAGADEWSAPIVNGTTTADFPAAAALLVYTDADHSSIDGMCSATLIGCRTVLTAGHCVCPDTADDAKTCEREGVTDPAMLQVFLQNAGLFDVERVALNPNYVFAEAGDLALLTLRDPVNGIVPSPINLLARPVASMEGTIVGFGRSGSGGGGPRGADDTGIKRQGSVTLSTCVEPIPNDTHVCWQFLGTQSGTCSGDSGGSLFVDMGTGPVLAGVTSGGTSFACRPPDASFDVDVFVYRSWLASEAGADLGMASCGDLPAVGSEGVYVLEQGGTLTETAPDLSSSFVLPADARLLRIVFNGQLVSSQTFPPVANDFDLLVKAGSPPTDSDFDCQANTVSSFGSCELPAPAAGTYHVLVRGTLGDGAVQITATVFPRPLHVICIGDCSDDGVVTIDDLLKGVAIALGSADLGTCSAFDANADGIVTINEIVAAVDRALESCPAVP